jgi:hypothetical protein
MQTLVKSVNLGEIAKINDERVENSKALQDNYLERLGAWLSLARALGSGPRGRWFKSSRPDFVKPVVTTSYDRFILLALPVLIQTSLKMH